MNARYTTAAIAAASATALMLSACSSEPSPAKTQKQAPTQATMTSPLDDYLAVINDKPSLYEWEASAFLMREGVIAQCMTDKGFEYIPRAAPKEAPPLPEPEPMSESWIAANGFAPEGGDGLAFIWPEDTNGAYIQSLSAAAKDAYWEALQGSVALMTEEEYASMSPEEAAQKLGCLGQATLAQNAIDPQFSDDFADFRETLEELEGDIFEDPAMANVVSAWSDCMADAGFTYSTRGEMRDAVRKATEAAGDPFDPANEAYADAMDAEIETALTDLACYKKVGWAPAEATARKKVEAQFVADNKAALDEYIEAIESVRQEIKPAG